MKYKDALEKLLKEGRKGFYIDQIVDNHIKNKVMITDIKYGNKVLGYAGYDSLKTMDYNSEHWEMVRILSYEEAKEFITANPEFHADSYNDGFTYIYCDNGEIKTSIPINKITEEMINKEWYIDERYIHKV